MNRPTQTRAQFVGQHECQGPSTAEHHIKPAPHCRQAQWPPPARQDRVRRDHAATRTAAPTSSRGSLLRCAARHVNRGGADDPGDHIRITLTLRLAAARAVASVWPGASPPRGGFSRPVLPAAPTRLGSTCRAACSSGHGHPLMPRSVVTFAPRSRHQACSAHHPPGSVSPLLPGAELNVLAGTKREHRGGP